jgi:Tol biopolymer transport system component/DNA-binding winged helix-turn-helix (wHTH) protein
VRKRLLWRGGEIVSLKPKAFETLLALVEAKGEMLGKEELLKRVWPDTIVEEGNLTFNISSLRKALGDDPRLHEYIVTIPGEGYRFVAGVRVAGFDELEVRERTRVSIEEVTDSTIDSRASASTVRALPGSSERVRVRPTIIAASVFIILLAVGGIALWRYKQTELSASAKTAVPFQQNTIKRLTNLGNALQAALSPDGKLFVHSAVEKDGRHSLWLGHTDGGDPVQLRPPEEIVYQSLTFAPDGSGIYFVVTDNYRSNGSLFRMPVFGGVPEKIKEPVRSEIALAPDGKRFAFTRTDRSKHTSSVIVANVESMSEGDVASRSLEEAFVASSLAWSPDSSSIAVAAVNDASGKKHEIFILNVANGSTKQLTSSNWAAVYAITCLRDGTGLIVAAKDDETALSHLWYVSSADGTVRPVVSDLNSYNLNLSMPTSNDAVLTVQYQYYSNIWVTPADNSGGAKQISFGSLGRIDGVRGFDWTPDGHIVYKANVDNSQTIWAMDASGGSQKQLLPNGYTNNNLSVTYDGQYVVFESNRGGKAEIWLASIDGSDIRQLTNGGNNSQPHSSPAGKWIVYKAANDDVGALWRISVDGGTPTRLTERGANWPRISPDGRWVACEYNMVDNNKLAIVPIEGGTPVKLFDVPRLANFSYGIRWTPDGQAITYHDWATGIWKQSLNGGQPERLVGLPEEKMFGHGWSRDGKLFAFVRGVQIRDVVLIRNLK